MSLIYLDNSATSFPKAPGMAEAVKEALLTAGTSGRASYDEVLKGSRILYKCRTNIAQLLGVRNSSQIILNSGATESLNTVIKGYVRQNMRVLTSGAEHNSVMRVLEFLKEDKNITVDRFLCRKDGMADLKSYSDFLSHSPDLVILCHSSNVTGAVYPIKEMIKKAHSAGSAVCIDGAQSAGYEEINLQNLNPDFFCFSGHKGLLGPAGTGGFYIKEGQKLQPLIFGGTGSRSEEEIQPNMLPDKYESGTRNIPGLAGLAESSSYVLKTGIHKIQKKEQVLSRMILENLSSIEGITIYGPKELENRNSVVSFTHDSLDISQIAEILDNEGIAMRMGLHCTPSAHKVLGTFDSGGTIRLSPGYFNNEEEIMGTIDVIRKAING
ncbi:MAG: aminotransferase class V-fold PLP-dependent enzyme [Spirochaetaceae bacterium]|nr:aminotransferase class V-fold PLP-dependent enzyme [Spirochaetaceae bacterium]